MNELKEIVRISLTEFINIPLDDETIRRIKAKVKSLIQAYSIEKYHCDDYPYIGVKVSGDKSDPSMIIVNPVNLFTGLMMAGIYERRAIDVDEVRLGDEIFYFENGMVKMKKA